MRRLLLGLGSCLLLVAGLSSPSTAVTNSTVIVRGTSGTNPQLTSALSCAPSAASLSTSARTAPWQDARVPSTPVPSLAPASGSRYLSYSGAAGYGHGPVLTTGANRPPTSVSAYVAAPSGSQSAVGFVLGYGTAPKGTSAVEYLGVTSALTHLGPGWTKVGFTTTSPAKTGWKWYAFGPNSASPPVSTWTGPYSSNWTLASIESGRSGWTWKAGILVGCGDSAAGYVDALAVTTSAGTTTYDFEGAASSVTATASSQTITYGQSITVGARATAENGTVPLLVVRCQGLTCQYVGSSVTSSPSGPISFEVFPEPGWTYGVRFPGDATFNPAQATIGTINVRPYLTAALSQRRIHVGQRVNVGGIVGPCTGTARHLVIQRLVRHRWKKVGRAMAPACGINGANQYAKFHGSVGARSTGRWKLRILVPSVRGYATTNSRPLRLTVTRAPVRHVTVVHYAPAPTTSTNAGGGTTSPAPPPPV